MKPKPGSYALILRSDSSGEFQVGRWGRLTIRPAYYIYVGSAFGPGGVKARVLRHFGETKSKHWHIDYLRQFTNPVCAWYSYKLENQEHRWAQIFLEMTAMLPIKGFGCSDCKCFTHLFTASVKPDLAEFSAMVGSHIDIQPYIGPG